jgi:hypothetical protein
MTKMTWIDFWSDFCHQSRTCSWQHRFVFPLRFLTQFWESIASLYLCGLDRVRIDERQIDFSIHAKFPTRNFDWLSFTPLWSPSPVLHKQLSVISNTQQLWFLCDDCHKQAVLISESHDDSNWCTPCRGKSDQHTTHFSRSICVWSQTIHL